MVGVVNYKSQCLREILKYIHLPILLSHDFIPGREKQQANLWEESGPCNLYPWSNADFQFNTLGKQKVAHTVHSGQEPLKSNLKQIMLIQAWILQCNAKQVDPVHVCEDSIQLNDVYAFWWKLKLAGLNSNGPQRVQSECGRNFSFRAMLY